MATYQELRTAEEHEVLGIKIRTACLIAAEAVRTEAGATTNHANRLKWALAVHQDPDAMAKRMIRAVIAQNAGAALSAITGASDATVQTAVNNAVDVLAQG